MRKPSTIVGCVLALGVAAWVALHFYFTAYGIGAEQALLYETSSPVDAGEALFLQEGALQGLNIALYVRDHTRSAITPLFVAAVWYADDYPKFTRAVWSRDGTVIAIDAGHDEPAWIAGYDFGHHQPI